jgi:hypothetical protein
VKTANSHNLEHLPSRGTAMEQNARFTGCHEFIPKKKFQPGGSR